jgi:tRNA (guanine37-N1)-methyltransferase
MKIHILSIFPEIFSSFLGTSLIKKGLESGALNISVKNFRDFAKPPHNKVDDTPYGGGAGMVMKPEPIVEAVEEAKQLLKSAKVILLSPRGARFNQEKAKELAKNKEIIFICGRYEGIDERVSQLVVDEEISLGDFVMMGGEVAAMAIIEATARLLPGVIGNTESPIHESFSKAQLEAPQYTRPPEYRGLTVPEVLLSGDHKQINKWREDTAIQLTKSRRPDLSEK